MNTRRKNEHGGGGGIKEQKEHGEPKIGTKRRERMEK